MALRRFGYPVADNSSNGSWGAKIGNFLYGTPFIGSFVRSLYFKDCIKRLKGVSSVLDAGCGTGDYAFYLANKFSKIQINAVDIGNLEFCKKVQDKLGVKNINFFNFDLTKLDEIEQYDFIYSNDVLEHIEDKGDVVKRFYAALKTGGLLYIHVPHKDWNRICFFNPKIFKKFYKFIDQDHIGKQFDSNLLLSILEKNNFKIVDYKISFGYFGKLAWEIDQICQEYNYNYIKAMLIPFLKLLCIFDTCVKNRIGCGMAVLVEK